ncbi:MAG TPA: DUF1330 domain-containing protein [Chitinophagaceae bacterium]|jgi:uncharacterized protein (DUF1330 family)|nr:DUF1330 domain-containing protein [Chitinophagaceae bacterium]
MIYCTQLIYLRDGQEAVFHQFEAVALPIIARYNGQLLLRLRPGAGALIEGTMEPPYEVHLVAFETEADLARFLQDEERKTFLHLKEQSIQSSVLIKGERL